MPAQSHFCKHASTVPLGCSATVDVGTVTTLVNVVVSVTRVVGSGAGRGSGDGEVGCGWGAGSSEDDGGGAGGAVGGGGGGGGGVEVVTGEAITMMTLTEPLESVSVYVPGGMVL